MDIFKEMEEYFIEKYKDWDGGTQFRGSGERLRRLYSEMCWSRKEILDEVNKCLQAVFQESYSEMLVCKDVSVWTLCPHHLLPCNFRVFIGYIPNGKVLGLSKFARIAVAFGKSPIMQEQYTRELADAFWKGLEPIGLGVYVVGKHGCIGCRGVNQEISIVTSTLKGSFKNDHGIGEEFYANCR